MATLAESGRTATLATGIGAGDFLQDADASRTAAKTNAERMGNPLYYYSLQEEAVSMGGAAIPASAERGGLEPGSEAQLVRDRLQRFDQVSHVLQQRAAHGVRAAVDVRPIDAAREGLVFQLLHHRLGRQIGQLLRRPHLHARADEADQLVA